MKLVISVSGGGALGVGPLQFMRRLESDLQEDLGEKVTLSTVGEAFAGTSTGSIIAAGLCSGMSAEELFNIYNDNLEDMFKEKKGALPPIARSNYYRYDNANLKKMLYKYFPGKMDSFKKPIYIPTTYMNGESVEKVWDRTDDWMDRAFAILSSCSAPTYFDLLTFEDERGKRVFCDGGMWANDPIMVLESGLKKLMTQQKKYKTMFADGFKILSFVTTMIRPNEAPSKKNALGWLSYIMDEWIARCGNSNYFEACANLGSDNIFRCAPKVDHKYAMDDVKEARKTIDIWNNYYDNGTFKKGEKEYSVKKELLKFVKSTIE